MGDEKAKPTGEQPPPVIAPACSQDPAPKQLAEDDLEQISGGIGLTSRPRT